MSVGEDLEMVAKVVDVKRHTGPPGCGLGLFADVLRLTGPPGCGLGLFADVCGSQAHLAADWDCLLTNMAGMLRSQKGPE